MSDSRSPSFTPIFPPTKNSRGFKYGAPAPQLMIKESLRLSTILLIGAGLQTILLTTLPKKYALIPLAIAAVGSVVTTLHEVLLATNSNKYISPVVRGRSTVQFPHTDDNGSSFGDCPSDRPVVVFHVGIQLNHPLGILAPGVKDVKRHFDQLSQDLNARREDYNMLGGSSWFGSDRARNNTILWIYYFSDLEGLHRFAHDALHREAMDWVAAELRPRFPHIGVFHETFCAPPASWETVHVNCRPQLLAATQTRFGATDAVRWQTPLVVADHPRLRNQLSRLNITRSAMDHMSGMAVKDNIS